MVYRIMFCFENIQMVTGMACCRVEWKMMKQFLIPLQALPPGFHGATGLRPHASGSAYYTRPLQTWCFLSGELYWRVSSNGCLIRWISCKKSTATKCLKLKSNIYVNLNWTNSIHLLWKTNKEKTQALHCLAPHLKSLIEWMQYIHW